MRFQSYIWHRVERYAPDTCTKKGSARSQRKKLAKLLCSDLVSLRTKTFLSFKVRQSARGMKTSRLALGEQSERCR